MQLIFGNIFSRFSSDSEASASKLPVNLEALWKQYGSCHVNSQSLMSWFLRQIDRAIKYVSHDFLLYKFKYQSINVFSLYETHLLDERCLFAIIRLLTLQRRKKFGWQVLYSHLIMIYTIGNEKRGL